MSKSRYHKKLCVIIKTSKQPNLIAGDGRQVADYSLWRSKCPLLEHFGMADVLYAR